MPKKPGCVLSALSASNGEQLSRLSSRHLRSVAFCAALFVLCAAVPLAWGAELRVAEAAKKQDPAAIAALIKQHADVNAPLPDGATALHWATYWDNANMVDQLIRAGAQVNASNEEGATPLYLACINRNAAIVEKLLAAGANPNAELPSGESALMTASRTGSADIVHLLLAHGANVNAKEKTHGQTALMWAVAYEHPDVAKVLLDADAATSARSDVRHRSVNTGFTVSERKMGIAIETDLGGFTPLLFAARNGDIELGKRLLASGANVNDAAPSGNSALAIASHSGNTAFAMFLLEHGADPNAAGGGFAPLHAAVLRGDLPLMKALLDKGADPNVELTKGTGTRYSSADYHLNGAFVGATPYWLAAKYGEAEMMKVLAARGADPKHLAKDGSTAIMAAVTAKTPGQLGLLLDRRDRTDTPTELAARPEGQDERTTFEVVKLAVEAGVDPSLASKGSGNYQGSPGGTTPLMEAATRGYASVVTLLLDHGADVKAATKAGDTAMHMAAQGGFDDVIRILAAKGGDVGAKNGKGVTPMAMTTAKNPYAYIGVIVPEAKLKAAAQVLAQLGAKE